MTTAQLNLLSTPLIRIQSGQHLTLPGLLAALSADQVDDFPALRPHQVPAWHMFLVQLAALALQGAGRADIPDDELDWSELLRGMTTEFPNDEPWCLVVDDWSQPAFMQPPVPKGLVLKNEIKTSDALDLLITARNHDLKQAISKSGADDEWLLSLVSLQTSEGYGGAGNFGIVRMNGGSSSRPMLGLAPANPDAVNVRVRPGAWFVRDVRALLASRGTQSRLFDILEFQPHGGIGLTWLPAWEDEQQLAIRQLDPWFIEVCRRIRLIERDGQLSAKRGTSKKSRIQGDTLNGVLGDPWAPANKVTPRGLTIGSGRFDYKRIVDLLYSGEWEIPILAAPTSEDSSGEMLLVAGALSRGNSKTEGFQWRVIPFPRPALRTLSSADGRTQLFLVAKSQMDDIAAVEKVLAASLAIVAAAGDPSRVKKEHYRVADQARKHLNRKMDEIFFEQLWERIDAPDHGGATPAAGEQNFLALLVRYAESMFESELPTIPCPSIYRLRAETRARQRFRTRLRALFPDFSENTSQRGAQNAAPE
jgi:CRISPR system Cascade subunit CasA